MEVPPHLRSIVPGRLIQPRDEEIGIERIERKEWREWRRRHRSKEAKKETRREGGRRRDRE